MNDGDADTAATDEGDERVPYIEPTPAKKRKRAPSGAPRKRASGGGGGGGGGNALSATVFSERMQKLVEKQRQAAVRESARVVQATLEAHTDATLPAARSEADLARQHCAALLQQLNARTAGAGVVAGEIGEYAKLVARLNRAGAGHGSDASLFEQCAVALTQQSNEFAMLQKTVNDLLAAFGENSAKCDAVVRYAVGSCHSNGGGGGAVAGASGGGGGGDGLFIRVGPRGEGSFSVSTRNGRQTVRGAPGTHYLAVSLARENGGVQMSAGSEAQRRADAVRRQTIERQHEKQFAALVDPSALLQLELQRSAAAPAAAALEQRPAAAAIEEN